MFDFTFSFKNTECPITKVQVSGHVLTIFYKVSPDQVNKADFSIKTKYLSVIGQDINQKPYKYIHHDDPEHDGLHSAPEIARHTVHHHYGHDHPINLSDMQYLIPLILIKIHLISINDKIFNEVFNELYCAFNDYLQSAIFAPEKKVGEAKYSQDNTNNNSSNVYIALRKYSLVSHPVVKIEQYKPIDSIPEIHQGHPYLSKYK
jgi:hypothetical protein